MADKVRAMVRQVAHQAVTNADADANEELRLSAVRSTPQTVRTSRPLGGG